MKFLNQKVKVHSRTTQLLSLITLSFFILFLVIHGMGNLEKLNPLIIVNHGPQNIPELSTDIYQIKDSIRDLHAEFFIFSFLYLFIAAIWIIIIHSEILKKTVLFAAFCITIMHYSLVLLASIYEKLAFYLSISTAIFYSFWMIWIAATILVYRSKTN